MARDFGFVFLRGLLLSLIALSLSLPIVLKIHDRFGLGMPPFNGLFLMFCALFVAFVGAALVGAVSGIMISSHRSFLLLVAGGGLIWGLGVLLWFVPVYGGMVADDIVRSSAAYVIQNGNDLVPRAKSAVEAFQQGQSEDSKRAIVESAVSGISFVGRQTASRVPALIVLSWALLVPPLLAMWEYRTARQRAALTYIL